MSPPASPGAFNLFCYVEMTERLPLECLAALDICQNLFFSKPLPLTLAEKLQNLLFDAPGFDCTSWSTEQYGPANFVELQDGLD
jgi:hypothetical protein